MTVGAVFLTLLQDVAEEPIEIETSADTFVSGLDTPLLPGPAICAFAS
jgi:hypothetical protein